MRANIKIKRTTKRFKKLKIFGFLLFALVMAFGYWLPQYIILEEGIDLAEIPTQFYSCLLNNNSTDSPKVPMVIGSSIPIISKILPNAVISDIDVDEFVILKNHQNASLIITIEDDGESFWLKLTVEQNLGFNPIYKIYENWKRKQREMAISVFLRDFKFHKIATCDNLVK